MTKTSNVFVVTHQSVIYADPCGSEEWANDDYKYFMQSGNTEVRGIFSNKKAATKFIKENSKDESDSNKIDWHQVEWHYRIEEFEINPPKK
jgi:hypothetical protein